MQAGLSPYVATDPPQFIDGIKVERQEQHDLFNWVKSQLHVRPWLDPDVLPPFPHLQKWDSDKHSRLITLGKLIKSCREAQPGSTKMGLASGDLAEVWGLMNVKKGKNGNYTLQDLKENAQACNSSFISQEKLECSPETAQGVLLFTCDFARKWNSCPSNPLRGGQPRDRHGRDCSTDRWTCVQGRPASYMRRPASKGALASSAQRLHVKLFRKPP